MDATNNLDFIEKTLRKKHCLSLDSVPNIESLENPVGLGLTEANITEKAGALE